MFDTRFSFGSPHSSKETERFPRAAFNSRMLLPRRVESSQRFLAAVLLALFTLQSAQASFCCGTDLLSNDQVGTSDPLPCHGDTKDTDQVDDCCLSCVAMMPPGHQGETAAAPVATDVPGLNDVAPIVRPDQLYRPPI